MARRAAKLHQELELEWEGVALALELLQEVQQLRSENSMLRQRLGRVYPDVRFAGPASFAGLPRSRQILHRPRKMCGPCRSGQAREECHTRLSLVLPPGSAPVA
ncbi:hypothetical protein PPS11_18714 [Pseudomonas putida S11]|nr:hypothetical protein PPS11_18714 [Pseudomonas putida S11]